MSTLLPLLLQVVGISAVIGFVGAMAAHIQLQFCIDHRRVKRETGEPGWKIFGSILAPAEFYNEEARWVWRVRHLGLKAFAICIGCGALIAVTAAILDIKLG